MALLKISEPGGKPEKPTHKRAVGIDLGTTNSLVTASCGSRIESLPDSEGNYLLPSVVQYRDGEPPLVGSEAKKAAITDPKNTVVSVKRLLGHSLSEITAQNPNLPYQFVTERDDGSPAFLTAAGAKDPLQVCADILQTLADRAERCLKGKLDGAVITVPAYFDDAQRQQTRDAAKLAGLNVLRLLNEPTAAAVAYGLDTQDQGKVVVFDLGGGTFDVSLLNLQKGVFEVLATGGDTRLGGDDFDHCLADWIYSQGSQLELDLISRARLLQLANVTKEKLSQSSSVAVSWGDWSGSIDNATLQELCAELINKTINTCRRVLRDAAMTADEVDNIVLVGGATRMPIIRDAVNKFFGKPALTDIDPDQVVAIGAGIQADVLIGNKSIDDFLLLDVNPLSLGIETMGDLVEKIIPRNTTIPVTRAQEFTTFKDGQTAMSLHVVQGERELVSDCRSLARFELKGIPPMVAGAAKIRVSFQVDADGLLNVSAQELSTGKTAEIQVKPSYGLQADEIRQMLESSQENAQADMKARAMGEAKLEGSQLIAAISAASDVDGTLLRIEEAELIDATIKQLETAMARDDLIQIRALSEELNRVSGEFAARRMDLHIGEALRGEAIENLGNQLSGSDLSGKDAMDSNRVSNDTLSNNELGNSNDA